jgi:hypothetical protein
VPGPCRPDLGADRDAAVHFVHRQHATRTANEGRRFVGSDVVVTALIDKLAYQRLGLAEVVRIEMIGEEFAEFLVG